MPALKMLLDSIRIDGGTQPRAAIDEPAVADYAEALKRGAKLPPAVVFNDGTHHWLADGFHRYHGARAAGLDSLLVEIHEGTKRDAVLYSVGANATNGLRRTNDDKRKAVTTLLQDDEWRTWTDREIASVCSVAHSFVAKVRAEVKASLDSESSDANQRKYKDKHGNESTMDVSGIAESNKKREKTPAQQAKAEAKKQAKEEEGQRAKDAAMKDDEVPKALEAALAREREYLEQIKALIADDTKAELAKQVRLLKQAEQAKGVAMNQIFTANNALAKFGKQYDELRKITGAKTNAGVVEAVRVAFQRAA
jgi:hypothetical protein